MMIIDAEVVRRFLAALGTALSEGDVARVTRSWEVPSLVLSDEGVIAVSDTNEIEAFFAGAIQWYRARGLVSTRPEIQSIETLGARLCSVDVRWLAFDAEGAEKTSERSRYILRIEDDDNLRIRVALTLTLPGSGSPLPVSSAPQGSA